MKTNQSNQPNLESTKSIKGKISNNSSRNRLSLTGIGRSLRKPDMILNTTLQSFQFFFQICSFDSLGNITLTKVSYLRNGQKFPLFKQISCSLCLLDCFENLIISNIEKCASFGFCIRASWIARNFYHIHSEKNPLACNHSKLKLKTIKLEVS